MMGRLVFRFLTGQHLDGRRRTNGTFWYRGNRPLAGLSRASRWSYRAGWERMLFRHACLWGVIGTIMLWLTAPIWIKGVVAIAVLVGGGYLAVRLTRRVVYFQPPSQVGATTSQVSQRNSGNTP